MKTVSIISCLITSSIIHANLSEKLTYNQVAIDKIKQQIALKENFSASLLCKGMGCSTDSKTNR